MKSVSPRSTVGVRFLPNVRLSSHIAGSLNDEVHRMADYVIGDYKRFINGEPLVHEVTEQILMTH